jgi:pyruvate dehydrogenase E1 component beta subunit
MATITIREALNQALREELSRDQNVFLMGEEVAAYDGAYKVTKGLLAEFGDKRVIDTPITELGFAGLGVGAAMAGLRPVVEFMTFNFSILATDQIINSAAKMLYMSGWPIQYSDRFSWPERIGIPSLITTFAGDRVMVSPVPRVEGSYALQLRRMPKGLLKSAIRDDDPVVFMEQERMYGSKGEVPDDPDFTIPIGVADVKREGTDVTIVARSLMVPLALKAAEALEKDGVSCEVIDPRTIRPLDIDTIIESVKKTNRIVVAEESHPFAVLTQRSALKSWKRHLITWMRRSSACRVQTYRCLTRRISNNWQCRM